MAFTPTITSGMRGTSTGTMYPSTGEEARRLFNVGDILAELVPSETPFLSMMMKFAKQNVDDQDYKYLEHRPAWLDHRQFFAGEARTTTSSAAGEAILNFVVEKTAGGSNNVGFLTKGLVIKVVDVDDKSKWQELIITNVDSQKAIDCKMITNTPGWSIADQDPIFVVGTAFEGGAAKTEPFSDDLSVAWASCQIFKTNLSVTNRSIITKVWGPKDLARIRKDKLREHKVDIGRAFYHSERYSGTAGNPYAAPGSGVQLGTTHPLTTTIGMINACEYATTLGMGGSREFNETMANFTLSTLIDRFEEVFEFGSQRKSAFCGMGVISFFAKMALNEAMLTMKPGRNELGIDVYRLITPAGTLDLYWDPLLRGTYYKGTMVVVDMANVKYIVLRDTALTDVTDVGVDGIEEQYLSDVGLKIQLPETHCVMRFS